jgi:hypothetical protein
MLGLSAHAQLFCGNSGRSRFEIAFSRNVRLLMFPACGVGLYKENLFGNTARLHS